MTILGHSESSLIECSEVIEAPPALKGNAHLPAGKTMNDIEQAVRPLCLVVINLLISRLSVRHYSVPISQRRSRSRYIRCSCVSVTVYTTIVIPG